MDKVQFKVSSAIKDLVGKDLIRNDNIAVFELVKNSYDAFASKVVITFESDKITIADNGKGMTFDDLKNKWLFLAYSAKKDGSEDAEDEKQQSYRDKIGRHYAGAKGRTTGKEILRLCLSTSSRCRYRFIHNCI